MWCSQQTRPAAVSNCVEARCALDGTASRHRWRNLCRNRLSLACSSVLAWSSRFASVLDVGGEGICAWNRSEGLHRCVSSRPNQGRSWYSATSRTGCSRRPRTASRSSSNRTSRGRIVMSVSTHQSMPEPQQAAFRPQRTRSRNLLRNRHSRGQNLRPSLDLPCLGTQLVHQPDRDCRSCGADEQIADADKARRTARVIQSAWTRSLS